MGVFNLKPARDNASNALIVSDLDALISTPISFRLHGRTHVLKPVSTLTFFKVCDRLDYLSNLSKSQKSGNKENVIDGYTQLFTSVCESITRKDVEQMTHGQAHALMSIIIEHIQGKTQVEEKKKNPLNPQD